MVAVFTPYALTHCSFGGKAPHGRDREKFASELAELVKSEEPGMGDADKDSPKNKGRPELPSTQREAILGT